MIVGISGVFVPRTELLPQTWLGGDFGVSIIHVNVDVLSFNGLILLLYLSVCLDILISTVGSLVSVCLTWCLRYSSDDDDESNTADRPLRTEDVMLLSCYRSLTH